MHTVDLIIAHSIVGLGHSVEYRLRNDLIHAGCSGSKTCPRSFSNCRPKASAHEMVPSRELGG